MDPKGYETKPWWPYVQNLQEQIDAGGSGGGADNIFYIRIIKSDNQFLTEVTPQAIAGALEDGKELRLEFNLSMLYQGDNYNVSIPISQFRTTPSGDVLVGMINYQTELSTENNNVAFYCAKIEVVVSRDVFILVTNYIQTGTVAPAN